MAIDSALDKSGSEDVRQLMCNEKAGEINMQHPPKAATALGGPAKMSVRTK